MTLDIKVEKYLKPNNWYHGTTLFELNKICKGIKADYNIGNELDFGYGFYLMPEKKKAEEYITKILEYELKGNIGIPIKNIETKKIPIVIEFEFSPLDWYQTGNYNFKFLNKYNDEFANFVFHNRVNNINGTEQHNYDVIFGVMSDSVPTLLIQRYKMNEISEEEVKESFKKATSVKQISIHSQELCDRIKPTRIYFIKDGKELNVNDYCNQEG